MLIKVLTFLVLGAGVVVQLPPIPEMPIVDTGVAFDTGMADDTGMAEDTGMTEDTGMAEDTGTTDDTGNANADDAPTDTGASDVTAGTQQSASEITGEKGGCSPVGAAAGPWLLGLLGLLARRRL